MDRDNFTFFTFTLEGKHNSLREIMVKLPMFFRHLVVKVYGEVEYMTSHIVISALDGGD
jgi:hypothetical protein